LDGIEVLRRLRAVISEDSFLQVLMLTADGTPAAREGALAAGAKDFVTKPFNRVEVLLRVHNLLETRELYMRSVNRRAALQVELDARKSEDRRAAEARLERLADVQAVLIGDALTMKFQPVLDLGSDMLVGVEALARFATSPRRPPNEWFADAEEVGLGVQLELLAVQRAVEQFDDLAPDCFMALNVSPRTATADELRGLLADVPGERVMLELTEHARIDDHATLFAGLTDLRARGVRIAVDDAGAGYAGLQQILQLRPDVVKLDLELIQGVHRDPARRALASAMVTFARDIGAGLIAEGIESSEDLESLRALGVPWGQGFYLAEPGRLPVTRDHFAADLRVDAVGMDPSQVREPGRKS
jgi:EAL domain-containing protein (putative c-di-GMP-specific phosphodiesterase class I)